MQEVSIAEACVARTIGMLPSDAEVDDGKIPAQAWRWFSVAECIMGLVLNSSIASDEQDVETQDRIRREALKRMTRAAR